MPDRAPINRDWIVHPIESLHGVEYAVARFGGARDDVDVRGLPLDTARLEAVRRAHLDGVSAWLVRSRSHYEPLYRAASRTEGRR